MNTPLARIWNEANQIYLMNVLLRQMSHLLRASATEYAKLEKPLTEAGIGGWI